MAQMADAAPLPDLAPVGNPAPVDDPAPDLRALRTVVTAVLVRQYGAHQLDLVEDAVQDALVAAVRRWPMHGMPGNPTGWLVQVGRNRIRDAMRRSVREESVDMAARAVLPLVTPPDDSEPALAPLADDQMRLILTCCHPSLRAESRVALTLRCVGGLRVEEIARALRADPRAVAQRIVRAKRTLRDVRATFVAPDEASLPVRIDDALAVIYAIFAEGHGPTAGEAMVRSDLCGEAIRLTSILLDAPRTALPVVHALHALLLFTAARLPERERDGAVVTLAAQDRTRWDRELIGRAFRHLERAMAGARLTRYHVEAEIAALHAGAPSWAATPWLRVLDSYDRLFRLVPTAVVALAREIARAESGDVPGAFAALGVLEAEATGHPWPDLHAARGELAARLGRTDEARAAYAAALSCTLTAPVRAHLVARRDALPESADPVG